MPFGYNGKILHVDLTKQEWQVEESGDKWYRTYMGGSVFASYYLLKLLKPGVDPLSPDNVLIFACSVVTGAPISGWNRYPGRETMRLICAFSSASIREGMVFDESLDYPDAGASSSPGVVQNGAVEC